jgi:hypothetical protein
MAFRWRGRGRGGGFGRGGFGRGFGYRGYGGGLGRREVYPDVDDEEWLRERERALTEELEWIRKERGKEKD